MANDNRDELYTGLRVRRRRERELVMEVKKMRRGSLGRPREHGDLLYK